MARVYCAGPLFNEPERNEIQAIAEALEEAGLETFLPQRDGLELTNLVESASSEEAVRAVKAAIFSLDVYKLLSWSDAVVANLNGRVPDEGTVVEAALAWHSGKALVLFKNDARSPLEGQDNPMLGGLTGFRIVTTIHEIPAALKEQIEIDQTMRARRAIQLGEKVDEARRSESTPVLLSTLTNLFART